MRATDLLQSLGVTPDNLELAHPLGSSGPQHVATQHACLRCGRPATLATVLEIPGAGRRWIDRCGPCFLEASPPSTGPSPSLEETFADLRDAAVEAGVALTVAVDGEAG